MPSTTTTWFNDIAPSSVPHVGSLTDGVTAADTAIDNEVLAGLGAHAPSGGTWQLFSRLDVSQSSQSSYNSGSLASVTFTGGRWTTPDSTGGAYFGLNDGTYNFMRFRWLVGAPGDGRIAQCTMTDSGANWPEAYIRMVARGSWPHDPWPSGQVKMFDCNPGNWVLDWDRPQWATDAGGLRYFLGNVSSGETSGGGAGYWTVSEDWEPDPLSEWCENEFYCVFNTATGASGNGVFQAWAGPVGSTSEVTNWDVLGAVPSTQVANPAKVIYAPTPAGLQQILMGPYLGGSGGPTIQTQSDLEFAMLEVWVR